jgi:hypothetical protein
MQVPRFWRMKTQRYRLTGVRYDNGDVQVVNRPTVVDEHAGESTEATMTKVHAEVEHPAA